MTIHGRLCTRVVSRSLHKKIAIRSVPSGSPTSTYQRATEGNLGVSYSAVIEKPQRCFRFPRTRPTLGYPMEYPSALPSPAASLALPLHRFGTACARGLQTCWRVIQSGIPV